MKAIFILEGELNENAQHELSKCVEELAKDFGLSSYLDDVIEDNVCEHNNTITNECFDCNEQERKDYANNQDKEHLEMEIDMLKVNIESLCEELHSYCDLWFMKLYIWIKRIELPNCKELMSGRW